MLKNVGEMVSTHVLGRETGDSAGNAFTYSLFYVFYDQYTYIRGVLS